MSELSGPTSKRQSHAGIFAFKKIAFCTLKIVATRKADLPVFFTHESFQKQNKSFFG